ncbi:MULTISPECIES: YncE family protein [Bacillus]|uniref:YncE family protein n=1 Tax=Bacillus TaxID=1386 RepID=UPI00037422C0|nr:MULTISPECIES: hypothetical protein [Bacillus]
MKKLGVVLTLLFLFVLSACNDEVFPSIPANDPFIATVNLKESSITFVDGHSYNEIATWDVHQPLTGAVLIPELDEIVIYGKEMSEAIVYSLEKGEEIAKWETGKGIVHISRVNDKDEFVLVDQNQDSIRIFTYDGKEVANKKVGNNPIFTYEEQQNKKLYVVNFNDEKITVLDSKTLETIQEIKISPFSTGILLREEEKQIWVGGHGKGEKVEENIHIYSTQNGELIRTLKAPSMPIQFLQYGKDIFVVSHGTNMLYKWDHNLEERGSLKVGVNPFEIKRFKNKLVVASYDSDDISIIHPQKFIIEKTIKVGKGPFQILIRE